MNIILLLMVSLEWIFCCISWWNIFEK